MKFDPINIISDRKTPKSTNRKGYLSRSYEEKQKFTIASNENINFSINNIFGNQRSSCSSSSLLNMPKILSSENVAIKVSTVSVILKERHNSSKVNCISSSVPQKLKNLKNWQSFDSPEFKNAEEDKLSDFNIMSINEVGELNLQGQTSHTVVNVVDSKLLHSPNNTVMTKPTIYVTDFCCDNKADNKDTLKVDRSHQEQMSESTFNDYDEDDLPVDPKRNKSLVRTSEFFSMRNRIDQVDQFKISVNGSPNLEPRDQDDISLLSLQYTNIEPTATYDSTLKMGQNSDSQSKLKTNLEIDDEKVYNFINVLLKNLKMDETHARISKIESNILDISKEICSIISKLNEITDITGSQAGLPFRISNPNTSFTDDLLEHDDSDDYNEPDVNHNDDKIKSTNENAKCTKECKESKFEYIKLTKGDMSDSLVSFHKEMSINSCMSEPLIKSKRYSTYSEPLRKAEDIPSSNEDSIISEFEYHSSNNLNIFDCVTPLISQPMISSALSKYMIRQNKIPVLNKACNACEKFHKSDSARTNSYNSAKSNGIFDISSSYSMDMDKIRKTGKKAFPLYKNMLPSNARANSDNSDKLGKSKDHRFEDLINEIHSLDNSIRKSPNENTNEDNDSNWISKDSSSSNVTSTFSECDPGHKMENNLTEIRFHNEIYDINRLSSSPQLSQTSNNNVSDKVKGTSKSESISLAFGSLALQNTFLEKLAIENEQGGSSEIPLSKFSEESNLVKQSKPNTNSQESIFYSVSDGLAVLSKVKQDSIDSSVKNGIQALPVPSNNVVKIEFDPETRAPSLNHIFGDRNLNEETSDETTLSNKYLFSHWSEDARLDIQNLLDESLNILAIDYKSSLDMGNKLKGRAYNVMISEKDQRINCLNSTIPKVNKRHLNPRRVLKKDNSKITYGVVELSTTTGHDLHSPQLNIITIDDSFIMLGSIMDRKLVYNDFIKSHDRIIFNESLKHLPYSHGFLKDSIESVKEKLQIYPFMKVIIDPIFNPIITKDSLDTISNQIMMVSSHYKEAFDRLYNNDSALIQENSLEKEIITYNLKQLKSLYVSFEEMNSEEHELDIDLQFLNADKALEIKENTSLGLFSSLITNYSQIESVIMQKYRSNRSKVLEIRRQRPGYGNLTKEDTTTELTHFSIKTKLKDHYRTFREIAMTRYSKGPMKVLPPMHRSPLKRKPKQYMIIQETPNPIYPKVVLHDSYGFPISNTEYNLKSPVYNIDTSNVENVHNHFRHICCRCGKQFSMISQLRNHARRH